MKKLSSLKWGSSNSFAKPKLPEEQYIICCMSRFSWTFMVIPRILHASASIFKLPRQQSTSSNRKSSFSTSSSSSWCHIDVTMSLQRARPCLHREWSAPQLQLKILSPWWACCQQVHRLTVCCPSHPTISMQILHLQCRRHGRVRSRSAWTTRITWPY